ncbi:c-type cytochrome [Devosia nitrariae]|uniref:Cytochrome c n=1 Tax=Devosia nitrariae TaxID=2071872 RepID=A0ABQ5W205_9HYPH|nr:cytochrome c [Devosia nitrariae]GLQ53849.1 cytochrome c [Devosia nitrariae]
MHRNAFRLACAAALATLSAFATQADEAQVARGKYLVNLGGCHDCHTPGYFLGQPDMSRYLGGSDVGFEIPGLGMFLGPNLTPDEATGLGGWSDEEVATALTTGKRPDDRVLAPIMPYHAYSQLTDEDVQAIVEFLRSIPAVSHEVPGPFGPGETVPTFIMRTLPPGETAARAPR